MRQLSLNVVREGSGLMRNYGVFAKVFESCASLLYRYVWIPCSRPSRMSSQAIASRTAFHFGLKVEAL